jgi:hypothetical protein
MTKHWLGVLQESHAAVTACWFPCCVVLSRVGARDGGRRRQGREGGRAHPAQLPAAKPHSCSANVSWQGLPVAGWPHLPHPAQPRWRTMPDCAAAHGRWVQGGVAGSVRSWALLDGGSLLLLNVRGNRWCGNIGRAHRSNGIFYVVDLQQGWWCQRCYDPDCRCGGAAAWAIVGQPRAAAGSYCYDAGWGLSQIAGAAARVPTRSLGARACSTHEG